MKSEFKIWQIKEGDRLYLKGPSALSNSELLAFILRDRRTAENLLAHFPSLKELAGASIQELKEVKGINGGRAEILSCCFELLARLNVERLGPQGMRLRCPADVANYLRGELGSADREIFKEILLTTKNTVISVHTLAMGSLNAAMVHPRELLKTAIKASAAGIILCHNHPSGDPEPSAEDVELTTRFVKCCELIGIELLDHVIIGNGTFRSLKDVGVF
jgi:DNA repair protein RadC